MTCPNCDRQIRELVAEAGVEVTGDIRWLRTWKSWPPSREEIDYLIPVLMDDCSDETARAVFALLTGRPLAAAPPSDGSGEPTRRV